MAFLEYYRELQFQIPRLELDLAQSLINQAWTEIKESRAWSFLRAEGYLFSPAAITTGTVSVTQFSASIQFNAAAQAILDVTSNPSLGVRQIRIGGGPPYSLRSYTPGSGAATLDRPYLESVNASATYSIFRAYYSPPSYTKVDGSIGYDFLRLLHVWDPTQSYSLDIYHTQMEINARDPQRSASNNPIWIAPYDVDANPDSTTYGYPRYEFYPHPKIARAYRVLYQKRGMEFSLDTDALPPSIPKSLLMEKALEVGCDWAEKNKSRFKDDLGGVNWINIGAKHRKTFETMLTRQQFQDKQMCTQEFELPYGPRSGIVGANYARDRAMTSPIIT